jgi:UDP:flavonoid glycosyltransferase YjiC (YdhE family)
LVHSHPARRSSSSPKADQFYDADRAVAAGAAVELLPDRLTADSARDAVRMLLQDESFRGAAQRIKNELDAMPDPQQAVESLEQLTGREPVQHGSWLSWRQMT